MSILSPPNSGSWMGKSGDASRDVHFRFPRTKLFDTCSIFHKPSVYLSRSFPEAEYQINVCSLIVHQVRKHDSPLASESNDPRQSCWSPTLLNKKNILWQEDVEVRQRSIFAVPTSKATRARLFFLLAFWRGFSDVGGHESFARHLVKNQVHYVHYCITAPELLSDFRLAVFPVLCVSFKLTSRGIRRPGRRILLEKIRVWRQRFFVVVIVVVVFVVVVVLSSFSCRFL